MNAPDNALPVGTVINSGTTSYRIEKVLGAGGFGITYQASTTVRFGNFTSKIFVAIKEHFLGKLCERDSATSQVMYSNPVKEEVENSRKDFIAEAQRLHKVGVNHRNIVKVNEVFESNNTAYYVMEFLDGKSLRAYVRGKKSLTEDEMKEVMRPIVDAVTYLHRNRMTHLDIKPDNIMLARDDDGTMRPVLIDFGLSKHYDNNGQPTSTINTLGCSDGYAPIEQYAGITTFSPQADVYAMGATMLFCLTGRDPKKSTSITRTDIETPLASVSQHTADTIIRAMCSVHYQRPVDIKLYQSRSEINETGTQSPLPGIKGIPNIPQQKISKSNMQQVHASQHVAEPIQQEQQTIASEPIVVSSGHSARRWIIIGGIAASVTLLTILIISIICSEDAETLYQRAIDLDAEEKYTESAELYLEAAEKGHSNAQFCIGYAYFLGEGVEENDYEAVRWFKESALQNNDAAQYYLGLCYNGGYGVTRDANTASYWLRKAANQGRTDAYISLGDIYYTDSDLYDYSEAFNWYKKAADSGSSRATRQLAKMYYYGQGTSQSNSKAFELFSKAADSNDAEAQYYIGVMYENGHSVTKNLNKAFKWYLESAQNGNMDGQFSIGYAYFNGLGTTVSYTDAVKWYRRSADKGNAAAMCNLGYCYENGYGVGKDLKEAFNLYLKGAEYGSDVAMGNVAICYEDGIGTSADRDKAIHWYRKASDLGNKTATDALKRLGVK